MQMNLYIRYFDDECVVTSVDDALRFIATIPGFVMTPQFERDFCEYAEGPVPYPKRYKVRPRLYFIVIKTNASTLEEFKANGKGENADGTQAAPMHDGNKERYGMLRHLTDEQPGWYEATLNFKRVVQSAQTGKFEYVDTLFVARVKAHSGQDCYNRIIDHLRTRADIDHRSQFPSVKGKNFRYTFLGIKPYAEVAV